MNAGVRGVLASIQPLLGVSLARNGCPGATIAFCMRGESVLDARSAR